MEKRDLFIFGMILQGDIYKDGFGTTEEDEKMFRDGLLKAYEVKEDATEEELIRNEKQLEIDAKQYVQEYRERIKAYLNS